MKPQDRSPRHAIVRVLAPHSHSKMPSSHILAVSFLPAFTSFLFLSWISVSLCRSFAPKLIHIRAALYFPAGRPFHSHLYISLDPGLVKARSIYPNQSALLRHPSCASFVSTQKIVARHIPAADPHSATTFFGWKQQAGRGLVAAWTAHEGGDHKRAETTSLHSR
jgi:hypothetical protein